MKEVFVALAELQKIDNEIYRYMQQKDSLANTLNELKDLVASMEKSIEEKRLKLQDVESWYEEQRKDLKTYNERMSRIKSSLATITKTKEYLIRQKELESLRRHKQSKEEEIEKVKETIEDFKEAIARDERKIGELKLDTEKEGGATWAQVRQLQEQVDEISKKREAVLPSVPRQILARYERVRDRRDGLAIVEAREGSCGGCHVRLRPQVYNQLFRMESLETCPSCDRFIYVGEETVNEMKAEAEEL